MSESEVHEVWNKRRAQWYSKGLRYSDYAISVVDVIKPVVVDCSSLLDLGAGTGALSIPLAYVFEKVTALDPSAAMLEELRQAARSAGVENILTETAAWEDAETDIGEFDVVLCANVPGVVDNPLEKIPQLERHARRFVFLVLGTPRNANKFFLQEIWPLIFEKDLPRKPDYFAAYSALYRMGIFANVAVVDYNFDQPFRDVDEAVLFWKDHLRLSDDSRDTILRDFLAGKLESSDDLLWARIPKQSAIIWWEPEID